ncbi:MAG: PAS domain S-box protein [Spirochaetes bacterium]|nr:PAS domain S-box protein [Spirochaetota bacterium]
MKERILIVEDEPIIAMDVSNSLRNHGYRVTGIASSDDEAMKLFASSRPDIVLMDIVLQDGSDGIDTARRIRVESDIPIIFMTAHADPATVERARDIAPSGYLNKPINERDLFSNIDSALYRYHMESRLRESEERFRTASSLVSDNIFEVDLPDLALRWYGDVDRLLGYGPDTIAGTARSWLWLVHPDDRPLLQKAVRTAVTERGRWSGEYRVLRPGGGARHIHLMGTYVQGHGGGPDRLIGALSDITARKEAEEQIAEKNRELEAANEELQAANEEIMDSYERLRESEERYRAVSEKSHMGIAIVDDGYRITYMNDEFCRVCGYEHAELIGTNFTTLLSEKSLEMVSDRYRRRQRGEDVPPRYEFYFMRKGHEERIGEMRSAVFRDSSGRMNSLLQVLDITEQKRIEQELRDSRENLQNLFDTMEDFLFILDPGRRIIWSNPAVQGRLGYSGSELSGMAAENLYRDDESGESGSGSFTEVPSTFRLSIVTKDGFRIPAETKITAGRWNGADAIFAVSRDISELQRMHDELRQSEQKFSLAFQGSPIPMVLNRMEDGAYVEVNEAAQRQTGYRRDEVIGKNPLELQIYEDPEEYRRFSRMLRDSGTARNLEVRFRRKDGVIRNAVVNADIITIGQAPHVVTSIYDVTERIIAEEAIMKMEKLESLGLLAGGIAHDFNNMLMGIIGNISMVKTGLRPDDPLAVPLNDAEASCLRARDLTRQLLTFSRGGAPVKKVIYLQELLKQTVHFNMAGSNVRPQISIDEDLLPVEADEGQIGQVINNLTLNAVQAMPRGGTIEISARNRTIDEPEEFPLFQSRTAQGTYVVIEVRDHGVGIPRDRRARIFDPYFTTKPKGSGLGLAVVYSIVRNHDGFIDFESEPGAGTVFRVFLPAAGTSPEPPAGKGTGVIQGQGSVLVMDDEDVVLEVMKRMLTHLGYRVTTSRDGREAVELYSKALAEGRRFDAVVMDLTVPGGMGGAEAIAHLRAIDPEVKAVVSSGYSSESIFSDYERFGFRGYIQKPFRLEDLGDILDSLIRGGR